MNQKAIELISGRECIPEFILKICQILENPEFQQTICWNHNNNQIVIKDTDKLERQVLPNFFRHNKLRSFIRQLNMYRFRKVSNCQKNKHLHFKHQHFKRGNIEELLLIKRKKRNNEDSIDSDLGSEGQTETLEKYKTFVRTNIQVIQKDLTALIRSNPQIAPGFRRSMQITNLLAGKDIDYRLDVMLDQFIQPCPEWSQLVRSIKNFEPPLSFDSLQPESSMDNYGSCLDPTA